MRVAVIGGGIAGLSAAWELAQAHERLTVEIFEETGQLGGAVAPTACAGIRIDAGAEAFATRTPAVADLIGSLGLRPETVDPNPAGAWLQHPEGAAPLPATGILGIPAHPAAADVVAIIGEEAASQAVVLDRAPMPWGPEDTPSLGEVVRTRMGEAVVQRLVSPITSGVHSADPDDLSINAAHPALLSTMLSEGSLGSAVARLRAQTPAGSAVQSLRGGMNTLITALQQQLRDRGVTVHLHSRIDQLDDLGRESALTGDDHVILAVDEDRALALAQPWLTEAASAALPSAASLPSVTPPAGATPVAAAAETAEQGSDQGVDTEPPRGVALVTLAVRAPALDAHPRGTGMLVAPTVHTINGVPVEAKALTHITAKWQWAAQQLTDALGSGHHLVRLSYGRVTDDPQAGHIGITSDDDALIAAATRDLPVLMGLPGAIEEVLDAVVVRWARALPAASAESRQRARDLADAVAALRVNRATDQSQPALWVTGAWTAGTGLAQVIPHARATARAVIATRLPPTESPAEPLTESPGAGPS